MKIRWTTALRRTVLASLVAVTQLAAAQPPVTRIVVPFSAGGVTDQAARIVTERMARQLGQIMIVENRPGAGGRLGIDAVMKAPPDGRTLLVTNTSYSILPVIDPKVKFDPLSALTPVSLLATYSLQVVIKKDIPANTLAEFIAYARSNSGKLSYGSAGVGSGANFAGEYFRSLIGTSLVHVPYKSTTAALADVAGGQLDLAFDASSKPLVDAGRVKLLAVTGAKRDPRFPQTPTATEAGLRPFVMESWMGLLAPVGTPREDLERLHKAAVAAMTDPEVRRRLAELGLEPEGSSADGFVTAIRSDLKLYKRIADEAKLQFE